MGKKRSSGIIALSITYVFLGLLSLVLKMPIVSLLYIIIGIGIYLFINFVRYFAIILSILGLIINALMLGNLPQSSMLNSSLTILVFLLFGLFNGGVIYYLTRPKVKEQFK